MKKLTISFVIVALLLSAIFIAGCTGPAETNQDAIMNGTVADIKFSSEIFTFGGEHISPATCRITLTTGEYFTEVGHNAVELTNIVHIGQSFAFYIKGGHIEKIIETGNTPVPAVYRFRQPF